MFAGIFGNVTVSNAGGAIAVDAITLTLPQTGFVADTASANIIAAMTGDAILALRGPRRMGA